MGDVSGEDLSSDSVLRIATGDDLVDHTDSIDGWNDFQTCFTTTRKALTDTACAVRVVRDSLGPLLFPLTLLLIA